MNTTNTKSANALPKTLSGFLWHFIKEHKFAFFMVQLLALGWTLDQTAWPAAFQLLIDKLVSFTGDKAHIWSYLAPTLVFWTFMWLIIEVMFRSEGFLMARIFPKFEARIRMAMFKYVEKHSYAYFANNFSGNISNKISDMILNATRLLQLIIQIFVPSFLSIIITIFLLYRVHPYFAFLIIVWILIHSAICIYSSGRSTDLADIHSEARSMLSGKMVDVFTNIINVKLFARHRFENDQLKSAQKVEQDKQHKALYYIEKVKIALGINGIIFPLGLNTYFMIYAFQHDMITVGQVVLIFNLAINMLMMAWLAGLELPNLYKSIGICRQALSIIRTEHEIVDDKGAEPIKITEGKIVFDDVTFHYGDDNKIFENKNVTIEAGTNVGLVGFSGSGKSTFVNLIMRFFDVEGGRILIDGQDISKVTVDSLREQIAMIPQDPTLFHRSLKENIRYGKIDATDEEVYEASKKACCHDFIMRQQLGYDMPVGERGSKISGGQRQRIAIARAILKNAPILIMDEATSALDSVTEKHIQEGLGNLMYGRTSIVIAHRLSTLTQMDRILVFEQGCVVEDGSHEELLAKNGYYARLWTMQAGGFLPDSFGDEVEDDE